LQDLFDAGSSKPTPPDNTSMIVLNKVWENKQLMLRVKAFAWRIIRRAIPMG
jgi:hypothetical protein